MQKLVMSPAPGERLVRFVGDRLKFSLRATSAPLPADWRVFLRTNLGRAKLLRHEIIASYPRKPALANAAWHDLELAPDAARREWSRALTLVETGFFRAKAYAVDPQGRQHWPDGPDFGVSIHPDAYRTGNSIYCAFTRLFGATKSSATTVDPAHDARLAKLDALDYTVIPPSGKLRDLTAQLPHIVDTLGCRILHLLPVNPVPATMAKFGRFGSPYAAQNLTAVDPALVEFDQRTTGVDQFRELTHATHARGAKVFLDIVANHTGWGATLQEKHPEWYLRDAAGNFVSPGAWGTVWEDLVELDHQHPALWAELAEVFLTWCRRGVDGFRCDAGYKVPLRAWRYITARVLAEFPETIFLLEGLGGSWEATETLLADGAMQWAYSELFQNYSGKEVAWYLDYALHQSGHVGLYVHYSETHDNARLAEKGRAWSLLRNRLCALTSVSGGFGFTCGVEWLAAEKINVHSCRGLSWGSKDNLVRELAKMNQLLREHPCFFDGAELTRLSGLDSPVFALRRDAPDSLSPSEGERAGVREPSLLILINTDPEEPQSITLDSTPALGALAASRHHDLLGQSAPPAKMTADGKIIFQLPPASSYCLEVTPQANPITGDDYRRARAQAAWAVTALSEIQAPENIGPHDWRDLAALVEKNPARLLAAFSALAPAAAVKDFHAALEQTLAAEPFPAVVTWRLPDRRRITPVPHNHWLLLEQDVPFRATLTPESGEVKHVASIAAGNFHIASFAPSPHPDDAALSLQRFSARDPQVVASVRFLAATPPILHSALRTPHSLVLLTNGRGGMVRLAVDLGRINSKYDCLLGANLHDSLPVDRHIFAKRVRVWVNADGFITPLDAQSLVEFQPGPPAFWKFAASAGDGRAVEIHLTVGMVPGENTTVLRFHRAATPPPLGRALPVDGRVTLTVRVDLEDRNFHWETKRHGGADAHFSGNCREISVSQLSTLNSQPSFNGFAFTPAPDRQLRVFAEGGVYHHEAEWCENIPHPVEASRGQTAGGDAYSPGWFELPLLQDGRATLVVTAEAAGETDRSSRREEALKKGPAHTSTNNGQSLLTSAATIQTDSASDDFTRRLETAARAFVVRRGEGRSVIAGYPWFLDWGRDTLIAARGLLAAGWRDEVLDLLKVFGRFEQNGTLPNTIHGADASNRDTSDAPLWYGVVCEEFAAGAMAKEDLRASSLYKTSLPDGRTIADVLHSIATGYLRGTPNGIRVDAASALVWSPSHFTWMDTSFPAGTPREGYPIEIQALWIRLLRQLARLGAKPEVEAWATLAERAQASLEKYFWLEANGWFADQLIAGPGVAANDATPDNALRSNCLFAVSLELVTGERARRTVAAARDHLIVPGALRSLAPLPVSPPLAIHGSHGGLLNDPQNPYWPRYEGDEDTRRKPAYHNGTAWTWTFPSFCEALAIAWNHSPAAVAAARGYLGSMARLMEEGCLGQIPEILDGDAPHTPRGCDAQAWGATEALRVWKLLHEDE